MSFPSANERFFDVFMGQPQPGGAIGAGTMQNGVDSSMQGARFQSQPLSQWGQWSQPSLSMPLTQFPSMSGNMAPNPYANTPARSLYRAGFVNINETLGPSFGANQRMAPEANGPYNLLSANVLIPLQGEMPTLAPRSVVPRFMQEPGSPMPQQQQHPENAQPSWWRNVLGTVQNLTGQIPQRLMVPNPQQGTSFDVLRNVRTSSAPSQQIGSMMLDKLPTFNGMALGLNG